MKPEDIIGPEAVRKLRDAGFVITTEPKNYFEENATIFSQLDLGQLDRKIKRIRNDAEICKYELQQRHAPIFTPITMLGVLDRLKYEKKKSKKSPDWFYF